MTVETCIGVMSFGAGAAEHGRPVGPKRDLAVDSVRPPVPPVPRAPRAKPRSNTNGTLSRETRGEQVSARNLILGDTLRSSTPPSQCSEQRRPRDQSPFNYARQHSLERELQRKENQELPMGPARVSDDRSDFRRGHGLEKSNQARSGSCPPWSTAAAEEAMVCNNDGEPPTRLHARRSNLQRERASADQNLEWASNRAVRSEARTHGRRKALEREEDRPEDQLVAAARRETFSRVLGRQGSDCIDDNQVQAEEPVSHNRRSLLANERKLDGQVETWARVMGR